MLHIAPRIHDDNAEDFLDFPTHFAILRLTAPQMMIAIRCWPGAGPSTPTRKQGMLSMTAKLTETMIAEAALTPDRKKTWLWDTLVTGFGVRIRSGGSKTFWFQYRTEGGRAGQTRMVRIGAWPTVKLDDARKRARDLAGQVARGEDPSANLAEIKQRANSTLHCLLADDGEYERHLKRRQIVNTKIVMSGLRRGLAKLTHKEVKDITRQDFVTAITAIVDAGKPGAAEDLRKFSRTFCEWCVARGFVTANVMAGLRRAKQTRAEKLAKRKKKGRALTDQEIIAVWNACDQFGAFGKIMRMSLLCATRRSEIAKLPSDKVKSDRIELPPLSTKSGEQHEVPLTDLMRTVIASQPKSTSKLVFPSERTGRHVSGWSKLLPKLQSASGVTFTPHDLRRTARTLMTTYRVDRDVAELAIGHQREGLDKLYDFAELWDLRCDAFAKVSDHVARLLRQAAEPSKVVAIPTRTPAQTF
jgi:integrase